MKKLLLALPLLFSVGCVAGNNLRFDYRPASMPNVGNSAAVVVAADDARQYVVSGDEPKSFVGELRNGYGMPFNVTTEGEIAFSSVVAESVRRELEAAGFRAVVADNSKDLTGAMSRNSASRGLLVTVNEFKADTMNRSTVYYDLTASVLDRSGAVVATTTKKGEDVVEGSFMNPIKALKANVPAFFYRQIHALVSDPTIMNALTAR